MTAALMCLAYHPPVRWGILLARSQVCRQGTQGVALSNASLCGLRALQAQYAISRLRHVYMFAMFFRQGGSVCFVHWLDGEQQAQIEHGM